MSVARLANSATGFGLLTLLLHWAMAAGILGMLGLGLVLAEMQVNLSNLWLFGLHKSLGLALLALVLLRLAWHRASPPPLPLDDGTPWHGRLARAAHGALYLLMLAVPLTGWIASAATGLDVVVFGRWTLPPIAPVSERWEKAFFAAHGVLTKALIALVLVHVAGALLRRDGTLARMVPGRRRS